MCEQALSFIKLHVSASQLVLIRDASTAYEAWRALQKHYNTGLELQVLDLQKQMGQLQKRERETIEQYFSRAGELWNTLLEAGGTCSEKQYVHTFIGGLPKEYDTLVTLLLDHTDSLELSTLYPKLLAVERRHESRTHEEAEQARESVALFGGFRGRGDWRGRGRGSRGCMTVPTAGSAFC
jgi:hypothetical protein